MQLPVTQLGMISKTKVESRKPSLTEETRKYIYFKIVQVKKEKKMLCRT